MTPARATWTASPSGSRVQAGIYVSTPRLACRISHFPRLPARGPGQGIIVNPAAHGSLVLSWWPQGLPR